MELREAIRQISDIRQQMAKSEVFRGYRSLTVGFSGVLGIAAACLQPYWVSTPTSELGRYVSWWLGVAVVSLTVAVGEMAWRAHHAGPGLARGLTRLAIEQFAPCLVVGGLLTSCILRAAPQVGWMLPGLWSFTFALGVFASYRLLPKQAIWVGVYYTLLGCLCILWGQAEQTLAPWQMGVTFGGGQLLAAGILYWTLERTRDA